LEETHRPDAFRLEPFAWNLNFAVAPVASTQVGKRSPPLAALRRFRPPVAASIFTSGNRHLQSEEIRDEVIDQRGPYLLSGNWWDQTSWARVEWDLQLENGELIRAHETGGVWKIDGIYD
jgi:hypothetical protein